MALIASSLSVSQCVNTSKTAKANEFGWLLMLLPTPHPCKVRDAWFERHIQDINLKI
jgi:hypothetical protein